MKTLIWSVAWGDYSYMLQSLVNSIRNNDIDTDIMVFSDKTLKNCISNPLDKSIELDFKQYWKFYYLEKLAKYDYDLFVFIDSDHYFVRKPSLEFKDIIGDDPWYSFLESPINSSETKRGDWWGIKNEDMVKLYRDFGVNQKTIYNSNGGFWMCKKEFINHAKNTALLFRDFQKNRALNLPEEVVISIFAHLFSKNYENRFHSKYTDYWASEWIGSFKDILPDGNPWIFQEYMTGQKTKINPSIVHAMRSKTALIISGK
jgi:hypothetical protein